MKLLLLASGGRCHRHRHSISVNRVFAHHGFIEFPWATLTINITGSFLMGVLIEVLALRFNASNELRTFFATGILGGYTTFSAFSLDFATLYAAGRHERRVRLCCGLRRSSILFALFAGLSVSRWLLT